jgi:mannosyl-3-phosphoglycerate phosphatase
MKKIAVFTDLDGTLLDHHNYLWDEAKEALQLIQQHGYPLILNSSKTFAELHAISEELHTHAPIICENGAVIAVKTLATAKASGANSDYRFHLFGMPYDQVIHTLNDLRRQWGFSFTGFSDMTTEEIMEHTGLTKTKAIAASQRQASEPLLWRDTAARLNELQDKLAEHGLILTHGGRFHHVMSPADKGKAIHWVQDYFQAIEPDTRWISIGLGDSHNDIKMLETVDYPVLVHNPATNQPHVSNIKGIRITEETGPRGWNRAVKDIITSLSAA